MIALHVMAYLKHKDNSHLFLDPTYPLIDKKRFNDGADCKELYGNATK